MNIPTQEKFPCEKCGANLVFTPGIQSIQCEYCGHQQKIEVSEETIQIQEYSFEEALKNSKQVDSKSLSEDSKEIQCSGCGAVSLVAEQSTRCPFCSSPIVVDLKDSVNRILPESVLPFSIDKKSAQNSFVDWLKSRWFAPGDLHNRAQKDGMDGLYLPFWTYDSETLTDYRGERGEHYNETENYKTADGKTASRTVQKTRWYPASGKVRVSFDDVLVCASQSLPHNLIDALEPWELKNLLPFNSKYLSGFITERYKIDLKDGFNIAKQKMDPIIKRNIHNDIGGDEQRIHSKSVKYSDITYKHILLPLWISSFKYKDKVYRIIVNARTGEVSGERPYSWIKITLAVLLGISVLALGFFFLQKV